MDLNVVAYAALGLSLFVSAVKMGGWITNADPRAIINASRWALLVIAGLAVAVLVWLVTNGRWTSAMMLAAFMLPVFVQAAPRWRVLFGPLRSGFPPITPDLGASTEPGGFSRAGTPVDPDLLRQSIAVLKSYLHQTGLQIEYKPADTRSENAASKGSGNGRLRMSIEEALDVLGLEPTASAREIRYAHRRLEQKLDRELGGTLYLMRKINEAKDVLLGE